LILNTHQIALREKNKIRRWETADPPKKNQQKKASRIAAKSNLYLAQKKFLNPMRRFDKTVN